MISSRERNIFQNNVFVLSSWLLVESKARFAFEEIYYRKGKLEATVSYKLYSDLFEVIWHQILSPLPMTVSLQVWKMSQKFEPTREVPQFQPPFWKVNVWGWIGISWGKWGSWGAWWGNQGTNILLEGHPEVPHIMRMMVNLPYESLYNLHRWPKRHRYSPENL